MFVAFLGCLKTSVSCIGKLLYLVTARVVSPMVKIYRPQVAVHQCNLQLPFVVTYSLVGEDSKLH